MTHAKASTKRNAHRKGSGEASPGVGKAGKKSGGGSRTGGGSRKPHGTAKDNKKGKSAASTQGAKTGKGSEKNTPAKRGAQPSEKSRKPATKGKPRNQSDHISTLPAPATPVVAPPSVLPTSVTIAGVAHARFVTENQLDEFVRANAVKAQGVIVELVHRLVAASVPSPRIRHFPLPDSIGQPGPDGTLEVDVGFAQVVPAGRSFWEIGAGVSPAKKATDDYRELTKATPPDVRAASTFVFVTPLSGRRSDFQHTWKKDDQLDWLEKRLQKKEWKDVRVIDGTVLTDWMMQFPAVARWMAQQMGGTHFAHTTTPDLEWLDVKTIGEPPPLIPDVFLVGRDAARDKLEQALSGDIVQLRVETHSRNEVVHFFVAYCASLPEPKQIELLGRCLIVRQPEAWDGVLEQLRERHVLVPAFDITEDDDDSGNMKLHRARSRNHVVVFGARPGGSWHPHRVALTHPREHQLQEALTKAGYARERARSVAVKCGGNLASLLRLLQQVSLHPAWASSSEAGDLAIAELLGSWQDAVEADRSTAESLSGKTYGEWIESIRRAADRRDTPLTLRNGRWRVVPRYEAWHALARWMFDDHLERFQAVAISVLRELHPALDLPSDERYLAPIKGKNLAHSHALRKGIAESLALIGAAPEALVACTVGKPGAVVTIAVRRILSGTDWRTWASLDRLLPLLAEAAPDEFLDAVEHALGNSPSPFDELFGQEGNGFGEATYMAGLLWALETLAWEPTFLTRVTLCLARLDARDPGGRWTNRPLNSLTTIFLPWLPQTTAPLERKQVALRTLMQDQPTQAWRVLLALIPQLHGFSTGSHRPTWRSWIPAERNEEVTLGQYEADVLAYTEMCVDMAIADRARFKELLSRLDDLPPPAFERVVDYLASSSIAELPEATRADIWEALEDLVREHRRFHDAKWAMPSETVDRIARIAEQLAPASLFYRYRRLFSEKNHDLFDEREDFVAQSRRLDKRRSDAALDLLQQQGLEQVLALAADVEAPGRLGAALGAAPVPGANDGALLPRLLQSESTSVVQFLVGYARARYFALGAAWLDALQLSKWTAAEKLKLLTWLPFNKAVWSRVDELLGTEAGEFWRTTPASQYEASDDIDDAIVQLLEHGRPYAAVRCLTLKLHFAKQLDVDVTLQALLAAAQSQPETPLPDAHSLTELIEYLQTSAPEREELLSIEWAYLPALDRNFGPGPRTLEKKLATEPDFFCDVLRLVFRSERDRDKPQEEVTDAMRNRAANAYRLLSNFHQVPGLSDGKMNETTLTEWVDKVLASCAESGHAAIGQQYVGHVLAHSPSGERGEWPLEAIARILNRADTEEMRRGFTIQLYNNRGIHHWDAGEGERSLATDYHKRADAIETRGFHRLAKSIRELGDSYSREAERAATRDWDD